MPAVAAGALHTSAAPVSERKLRRRRTLASCACRCAALAVDEAAAALSPAAANLAIAAAAAAKASGRPSSAVPTAGPISAMRDENSARLTATSNSCSTVENSVSQDALFSTLNLGQRLLQAGSSAPPGTRAMMHGQEPAQQHG